ncbi:DNA-binding protein Alba [Candidatus Bathyarchaeota archaeon]|nr:DNA-binding protein Alba [Candidatus Bathyarchaeota archaeon]RJS88475.1 MAG: DNA-binding protein Alba [Candidatus Bathyarchaeota archaeon]RLI31530.1 MAG: DNA-binding protein Alba [Candidatus Bathyarchaeota archaeon]
MSRSPNVIYIGNKPPMNYVMALMQGLSMSESGEVVLKARGRAISRAVDVAEIARRRFMTDLQISKISIGTEELEMEEGGKKGVSTIEIVLTTSSKKAEK